MTPEEVDRIVSLCSEACATDKAELLFAAIVTDSLFRNIITDHPDPAGLAAELGAQKIHHLAHIELDQLPDDQRKELFRQAMDHMRRQVVAAAKAGVKAMKNGIITSDDLTADFLVTAAALACVGADDS